MVRLIIYSILGAVIALSLGLVFSIGQYIGSGNVGILLVAIVGAVIGFIIANKKNKK